MSWFDRTAASVKQLALQTISLGLFVGVMAVAASTGLKTGTDWLATFGAAVILILYTKRFKPFERRAEADYWVAPPTRSTKSREPARSASLSESPKAVSSRRSRQKRPPVSEGCWACPICLSEIRADLTTCPRCGGID